MTAEIAAGCVIIEPVSTETQARVRAAGKRYAKAKAELDAAEADLVDAMLAERAEGTSLETVARLTPLSNTTAYRWLTRATSARS